MLRTSKNTSIYTTFGRNRPIETIDGYDGTVRNVSKISQPSHLRWRIWMIPLISVIKIHEFAPLGSRSAVEMRSPAFHQSRYNSFTLSTWADVIGWTLSPRDPRADFQRAVDPTPLPSPRVLHLKTVWNLVPHGEN